MIDFNRYFNPGTRKRCAKCRGNYGDDFLHFIATSAIILTTCVAFQSTSLDRREIKLSLELCIQKMFSRSQQGDPDTRNSRVLLQNISNNKTREIHITFRQGIIQHLYYYTDFIYLKMN